MKGLKRLMSATKPSVWSFTGVKITPNSKAKETSDIALSIKADTIVKNGKPTDGHLVNLTIAMVRSEGFKLSINDTAHTASVTRVESPRGRKQSAGADSATVSAFLKGLTS
jgi:hypothetical protein